jgi:hypothetical protein
VNAEAVIVPDRVGYEIGWRAWLIDERELLLVSVAHTTTWVPRQRLEATCSRRHKAPEQSCACGIYAARTLGHLRTQGYHAHGVLGEVKLWGTIVEATSGFRAEFAYPSRLFLPYERWQLAKSLRERYGVPVRLLNPYEGGI